MRKYTLSYVLMTIAVTISAGLIHQSLPPDEYPTDSVFHVAIVGRGVESGAVPGGDLLKGVKAAMDDTGLSADKISGTDRRTISVLTKGLDDNNDPDRARRIARKLSEDPSVLAVIGHSSTDTTHEAAQIYAQAGIPLIIPLATAHIVALREPSEEVKAASRLADSQMVQAPEMRLPNCLRLAPDDDEVQAPAIALLVISRRFARAFIVIDSKNGTTYSRNLAQRIEALLQEALNRSNSDSSNTKLELKTKETYENTDQKSTIDRIVKVLKLDQNDVIIFCGYKDEAIPFLADLAQAYRNRSPTNTNWPAVIGSDACENLEVNSEGFRVYRAQPIDVPAFGANPPLWKPGNALKRIADAAQPNKPSMSAPLIYGYDAVQILAKAIDKCKGKNSISRRCVLDSLTQTPVFPGSCFPYTFRDGDVVPSDFYMLYSQEVARRDFVPKGGATQQLCQQANNAHERCMIPLPRINQFLAEACP